MTRLPLSPVIYAHDDDDDDNDNDDDDDDDDDDDHDTVYSRRFAVVCVCAGSPFTVKVNGPPDPSKVRVSGPGVHNGVLQEYDGSFTVNTQGAGPGELTVKIRGPKGSSCCGRPM